jgi:hypothetical protein
MKFVFEHTDYYGNLSLLNIAYIVNCKKMGHSFKNNARSGLLVFDPTGNLFFSRGNKIVGPPWSVL